MLLGTRVQFPPPPLFSHLREFASGFFHWIYINYVEKIRAWFKTGVFRVTVG
jgi:hypothetical protein